MWCVKRFEFFRAGLYIIPDDIAEIVIGTLMRVPMGVRDIYKGHKCKYQHSLDKFTPGTSSCQVQ